MNSRAGRRSRCRDARPVRDWPGQRDARVEGTGLVPLSEDEQRILQQIEQQLYESDPAFAGEIRNHSFYAHHLRRMKWAGVTFVLGVVLLIAALWLVETTFLLAFAGFVVMLGSALWFEHNLRKLGRAGMQQLTESMRAAGLRDYLGSAGQRVRDRFRKEP